MSSATRTPLRPIPTPPRPSAPAVPVTRRRPFPLGAMALAPASALPRKPLWRSLANQLPAGGVLIVLPPHDARLAESLQAVIAAFQSHGHPVTVIRIEQLIEQQLPLLL